MNAPSYSLFAVLALVACGADTDEDPSDPSNPDAPLPGDDVAPTVLSTSPAAGASAVAADAVITVTFSEPMNDTSVQNELDLSGLGDAMVTWNLENTEMTITPAQNLEVVVAAADAIAEPASYSVVIGANSHDQAGNPLGSDVTIDFTAVRELFFTVRADDELTRTVTPSETLFRTDLPLVVGDTDDDDGMRLTMTFPLDILGDATELLEATVATEQLPGDASGAPFDGLGILTLDHVEFDGLDDESAINAAFNSSQLAKRTFTGIASALSQTDIAVDVLAAVDADVADGLATSQFLLYFDGFTDLDEDEDRTVFSRDELSLELRWNAP